MTNKVYADNTKPGYRYTPAGRLYQRIWARGTTTTYATNSAGDIASIDYSDSTPDVTYSYDRLGRRTTVVDGAGTHVFAYTLSGLLLSETNTAGVLAGIAMTNRYDSLNRRTALGLSSDANALVQYGYDGASRMVGVTNGVNTASYGYVANSPLVSQIDFKNSGTTRMTTTKAYDFLNRLTATTNALSGGASSESPIFNYANNPANQRTSVTNADGSRWVYEYDSLGQVTSGKKYWSDGTLVLGQQFEYTFDDIGNRKTAVSGGDVNGRNKRTQIYSVNTLNQYTNRAFPGYLDVVGTAANTATVTVNNLPSSRKTDYYRTEVPVANSSISVWQGITNVAVVASGTNDYVTNWIGNLFVPKTTEVFGYDADGNQTNDGRWFMTWDGENRLIKQESLSGAPVGSSNRLTFVYDQQGRRISRVTEAFVSGAWAITLSNRFVCDGWNLVAELNATNNAVINSFVWGLDLSGSLQGAGGVGGFLFVNATNAGTHFVGFDGNGNVTVLVNASSGVASATYEYDPFGNVLRATGPMALLNLFRFSTKYTDGESGFNYYGYRFYNATVGRWVNRDPLKERGGRNVYAFDHNELINSIDRLGLNIFNIGFNRCRQITRRDGTPMVFFDPAVSQGGGWKVSAFELLDFLGSVPKQVQGFKVEYTASVVAYCKCGWDDCFQARKGTRIFSKTFNDPNDDWFIAHKLTDMPYNIPDAKTFLELIGEFVADIVTDNFPQGISITGEDAQQIIAKVRSARPVQVMDGKWKGTAPCDKY